SQFANPSLLQRVSKKQIAIRMLQNLHGAYHRSKDWIRAVQTLDLLIIGFSNGVTAPPDLASAYKRRGLFQIELKHHQAARRDLEKYLEMEPDAVDGEEIRKQIKAIHQ